MECNICFKSFKKLNKCEKCSFSCCDRCISKLNNIDLNYEDINYECCVCKTNNKLMLKEIKDINCLRNLYQKQSCRVLQLDNEIVLLQQIILIYNAPVITNTNITYYKNAIIGIKTQQDNNTISLELYDNVCGDAEQKIRMFNENELIVENNFIYSTNEYDYTLLKNTDFYELINNFCIDFV